MPQVDPPSIAFNPHDPGVTVGRVHVRDTGVYVGAYVERDPPWLDDPADVLYFQAATAANCGVLSINGKPYLFSPQLVAALKGAVAIMTTGVTL